MAILKHYLKLYKRYKTLILSIIGLIVILLPAVLVVSHVVKIVSEIKQYRYIGAGVQYKNTISVSGEGKVYTKPDIGLVNLSVVSEGARVTDVQDENSSKINRVIGYLKDSGIKEGDIKTTRYNLYPRYSYEERKAPKIIGYEITQTLEVKVRDLENIGEILEGVVSKGANRVDSLRFEVDKEEEFKEEARKLAIEEAKNKAKKLASQLGVKLIKISGYSEGVSPIPPTYKGLGGVGGGGEIPQIQVGETEIIANVTLIYEID